MPFPLSKKFQRLASMRPGEIAVRFGQEIAKRADSHGLFRPRFDSTPEPESRQNRRFFFDADEIPHRIDLIRTNVPDFEQTVMEQAGGILKHQLPLLGYGPLDYGQEIDWQLDIVSGKRAPLKPWPGVNYLDFGEVGDCKVTWELSRHQFLVTLAKAWLLTGDERFFKKLEYYYYDWHKKNPYPLGVNWASSLEVAFRSLSWIWVKELLAGCDIASQLRRDITLALGFNAWYIRRYLSTYFSPNTHLQGEAVALFFIGTLCPSFARASHWREIGWNILMEHALIKVREDGAYFEQSTYYHVYALDFFLHARVLGGRNGMPIPAHYDDVLKRMLSHLSVLCQAGPPPRLGDDDGGRVFDGCRNRAEHLLDPLSTGTALYAGCAFKQPGVCCTEEMLWLLGDEGLHGFSGCPETTSGNSARFSQTGLYISHLGAGTRSQAVMDAGALGGGSGGHGHADALSLSVNVDGLQLLIDPGTCNYVGPGSDREDFRMTRAHNTIVVDAFSQAEPRTAFSWLRWPGIKVEQFAFTPDFDFVVASHDGYTRLPSPVTHRRTLFTSHEGFWFVLDQLVADGPHEYMLHWHLTPDSNVAREAENRWMVERSQNRLHILTAAPGWWHGVDSGWFSPAYGLKQAAPVIRMSKKAQGAESLATVIWAGSSAAPVPVLSVSAQSPGMCAYELHNGANHWIFIFGDGVSKLEINGWESDASFIFARLDPDGALCRAIFVQCSFAHYDGETLHQSADRTPHFVWERKRRQ